ncbi:hypothetical protein [Pedobacter sp.]
MRRLQQTTKQSISMNLFVSLSYDHSLQQRTSQAIELGIVFFSLIFIGLGKYSVGGK